MPSLRDIEALLSAKAVQDIFVEYRRAGGNRDNLRSLLELLWRFPQERDRENVSTRILKARLEKCKEALETLLVVGLPSPLHNALNHAWREILRFQKSRETDQSVPKLPTGRPPLTLPTLVVAVLAREFRFRFGNPRYGNILVLVQAVAQKHFPPTINIQHLYQRAKHLKADSAVKDMHALFFSSTLL